MFYIGLLFGGCRCFVCCVLDVLVLGVAICVLFMDVGLVCGEFGCIWLC